VITRQATNDVAIDNALQAALQQQGLALEPPQRADYIGFLKKVGGLDYGAYAQGFQLQQVSPTETRVVPAGAGAPGGAGQQPNPAATAVPAGSQPANPAGASDAGADRFTGEVTRAGDNLTVRVDGAERALAPAPTVIVTRDGREARLSDIQRGDTVAVTTAPDGAAQRIDATSADDGAGIWRWLIPLLLGLLLLAGLLWFLFGRRKRDSFILEPSDTQRGTGG
jgi:hypothetical protein